MATFAAILDAKRRQQAAMEERHPGTLLINGTAYPGAIVTGQEPQMTLEGTVTQQRTLVFSVLIAKLPLSVVRDASSLTMKRLRCTHVETGITYVLREEWTDPNGVTRRLTLAQAEG